MAPGKSHTRPLGAHETKLDFQPPLAPHQNQIMPILLTGVSGPLCLMNHHSQTLSPRAAWLLGVMDPRGVLLLLLLSHFTVSDSVRPHRLHHPWDSPGKNTGVGCHFLLQCMKVKSQSAVAQSCMTLCDPMDCSLPGSSVHGIFQARVLEWGAITFSEEGRIPSS